MPPAALPSAPGALAKWTDGVMDDVPRLRPSPIARHGPKIIRDQQKEIAQLRVCFSPRRVRPSSSAMRAAGG